MAASISATINGIDQLLNELPEILRLNDHGLREARFQTWTKRACDQLNGWGFVAEAEQTFSKNAPINMYFEVDELAKMRGDMLAALRDELLSHPEHYEQRLAGPPEPGKSEISKPNKIFLGHGRNKLWARVHMYLKDELHLKVEAWESNPRTGLHALDVLKGILDSCTFAVMVATGEDATADGGIRARQNVVHEIGLFQGRLGFDKVALLQQRGVEEFSNLAGLQVIPFHDDQVEAAFYELQRMLKREKII